LIVIARETQQNQVARLPESFLNRTVSGLSNRSSRRWLTSLRRFGSLDEKAAEGCEALLQDYDELLLELEAEPDTDLGQ
jgi:hypothetical protein